MSRQMQLNIRVSPEEKKAWDVVSQQHDMPVSEIARRFLNAVAIGKITEIPTVPRPTSKAITQEAA
jgi:hypothetical protein